MEMDRRGLEPIITNLQIVTGGAIAVGAALVAVEAIPYLAARGIYLSAARGAAGSVVSFFAPAAVAAPGTSRPASVIIPDHARNGFCSANLATLHANLRAIGIPVQ